jgi:RND family efflux transporter MFP subunit
MVRWHTLVRTLVTGLLLFAILSAIYALWQRYQVEPITRDGKVRADIVPIAADVGGLVTDVLIHDNQPVKKGRILFIIDRPRYQLALAQARASLAAQKAALTEAVQEDRRNRTMPDVIAEEVAQQGTAKVAQLRAAVDQAVATRDLATLNLDRTLVRAPVDGTVSNVDLQPGLYLTAGKTALALVFDSSLRVEGYFEETKLPAIHVGDPASIYLMGVANEIRGHVESIAGGVEDRERQGSDAQLANVNPSFTWVRLAQRVPVRIVIDRVPPGVRLIPGQTASVEIHSRPGEVKIHRSLPW